MEGDEQETEEAGLPGPPPDPSRIHSIVRKVGDLNLQSEADDHGISKKTDPDIRAIMEFLDEVEEAVRDRWQTSGRAKVLVLLYERCLMHLSKMRLLLYLQLWVFQLTHVYRSLDILDLRNGEIT